jgi:hypothetical protein
VHLPLHRLWAMRSLQPGYRSSGLVACAAAMTVAMRVKVDRSQAGSPRVRPARLSSCSDRFWPASALSHAARAGPEETTPQSAPRSQGRRPPRCRGSAPCFPASCDQEAAGLPAGSLSVGRLALAWCVELSAFRRPLDQARSTRPSHPRFGHIAECLGAATHVTDWGTDNRLLLGVPT